MTDQEKREKVIKAIQDGLDFFEDRVHGSRFEAWIRAQKDALALLKVQEPIRPGIGIIHNEDGSKSYFLHCPIDGTTLDEGDRYCRKCGRKVKWE